ncbi:MULTISPECIES: TSUP family transporter [unclassified Pseudomonas]|uniref:TSUP family transporter n=1 Tax=Pseudomonas TaxID=286 RepID=UPI001648CEA5|nr:MULTISPECIES: TSUP family transporter [unclassified Pseudomonas]MBC3420995.1 TSUP family transporter [Pseudomonas sp. RW3S2]MBC3465550.1 TSUP family transporter [Pseudomonas sp. RW10S2]QXI43148.1 TSUP family transporter [Pseudomonas wayambapalatensis]
MMEIDVSLLLTLASVALMAGFFDAIAGGGGLITLPVLFVAGIDPLAAIATNKFQAASATVSATVAFARKGMIDWQRGLPMAAMAFTGGALGALSVSLVPKTFLQACVPVLLILVAAYFAFSPKPDEHERKAKISNAVFCLTAAPLIGFYDGVFGPGVGSFFMLACVILLGQHLLRAVCNSKLLNAACNLGALSVFSLSGAIIWPLALAMACAAFIGAQLGARCAVHFGPRLIKPLLVCVCCIMALKLLLGAGNPLGEWLQHQFL